MCFREQKQGSTGEIAGVWCTISSNVTQKWLFFLPLSAEIGLYYINIYIKKQTTYDVIIMTTPFSESNSLEK